MIKEQDIVDAAQACKASRTNTDQAVRLLRTLNGPAPWQKSDVVFTLKQFWSGDFIDQIMQKL